MDRALALAKPRDLTSCCRLTVSGKRVYLLELASSPGIRHHPIGSPVPRPHRIWRFCDIIRYIVMWVIDI